MIVGILAVIGLVVVSVAIARGFVYIWETYRLGEEGQKVYYFSKD